MQLSQSGSQVKGYSFGIIRGFLLPFYGSVLYYFVIYYFDRWKRFVEIAEILGAVGVSKL